MLKKLCSVISMIVLLACGGAWLLSSRPAAGWFALAIPTGSMRPAMPPGSLVLVHHIPVTILRVGDVVTYANPRQPGETVTHRIERLYSIGGVVPGIVTKGDANKLPDVPVAGGSVIGKVVWHAPYAGRLLIWAKTWAGITALVYLPALLIVAEEVKRLSRYYKLALPYRLAAYRREAPGHTAASAAVTIPAAGLTILAICLAVWQPMATALFRSNTVTLAQNRISTAVSPTTPSCQVHNQNTISISNSSTQTANSGSVVGPGAQSGNATNNNSSSISVDITNTGC